MLASSVVALLTLLMQRARRSRSYQDFSLRSEENSWKTGRLFSWLCHVIAGRD